MLKLKSFFGENMANFSYFIDGPWLVAGDFNQISNIHENYGGNIPSLTKCLNFKHNIATCNLDDLGFHGPKYTWSNRRVTYKHTLIKERLNRFLGNDSCVSTFPDSKVYHLYSGGSDHIPLILNTTHQQTKKKSFRYEPMWASDPTLHNIIQSTWQDNKLYTHYLTDFQQAAFVWNIKYFGNIFYKKQLLLKRLTGVQNYLSTKYSQFLTTLQPSLYQEYLNILRQEDLYWKLKSRIDWLNNGDKNTKFFHYSTLNRRRKNKIPALKIDDDNNWSFIPDQIIKHISSYYQSLYTIGFNFSHRSKYLFHIPHPIIKTENYDTLNRLPTLSEIKSALFSFKPFKSPGPDGLHPNSLLIHDRTIKQPYSRCVCNLQDTRISQSNIHLFNPKSHSSNNYKILSSYRSV